MWLDKDEIGYVYEYVHKTTRKWYVGQRKGKFDLTYTRQGVLWSHAKEKYGIDSFDLKILYEGLNFRQKEEEEILKQRNAQQDEMQYNLKNEAYGGSFHGPLNGMYGKRLQLEERKRRGDSFRGKKRPEHAIAMTGNKNGRYQHGKQTKEFTVKRKEYRESQGIYFIRETVTCPHCCLTGEGPNMTRYHFDKCKLNIENTENILGEFQQYPKVNKSSIMYTCIHRSKEVMNLANLNRWHNDNCKGKR